ncbi:hypothetical protein [Saccharicrinis fermentans]|uniref:Uncharacterized protein n=1 Tax=Saccharicrinis fermentans DSM 9555 = JCM 21142 TaxID=869213 RepID=W7Y416_9BACT|nr:hypothetical protein [Saccharicrinis fermentans]GAF05600.1 hypothetical protein JCM21142_104341 [Saccharicrinis fermentans DSM 9555 = JCM 21142]
MSLESVIQAATEKVAEKVIPVMVTEGTVTKVDRDANTCNVEREDLPDLFEVRLNAITSPGQNVVSIYPNLGSRVLVVLVENNKTDAYVITATDIDEIIINGGVNGGIAISQKVIDEIQEIKNDLNMLKTAFQNWAPANGDGGALLKTAATAWFGNQLEDPDPEAIINEKVKH